MAETKTQQSRLLVTLTALFSALCGLYLLIGGVWLVAIGGSWYYPIAGLVMLGVTVLLWRRKQSALWLYAAQRHPRLLRDLADSAVRLASSECAFWRCGIGAGRGAADQRRHPDLGRI